MTTVRQVEQALYEWAPRQLAASWDNVGHLVGDPDRGVHRVLVSLDITERVVREAVAGGFDLIVSHHPVMNCTWHPVQTLRTDDRQGGGRRQRYSRPKAGPAGPETTDR